jgi:5-methylcytosine-specific restriction endonuclease McrA
MTQKDEHLPDYVTPEVRNAVLTRDQFRCRRCGEQNTDKLTLHHVEFRSQGGAHTEDNLVTVCWQPCHALIHNKKVTVVNRDGHWFFGDVRSWRHRQRKPR